MKLKKKKGWADRRLESKRIRAKTGRAVTEWLVGCVVRRDGQNHGGEGFHSHGEVRRSLGDENPYTARSGSDDQLGFLTNQGRFVGRNEGSIIAVLAGQAAPMYEDTAIMSCDINWRIR